MPCHSCTILAPINNAAAHYAQQLFEVLAPGSLALFQAFVGCWLVWKVIRHGILKPGITLDEFLKPILLFSLVIFALRGHDFFWEYIYTPIHQGLMSLLSTIIRVGNHGQPTQDLSGMLEVVEVSIFKVTEFCERVYGNAGWMNPIPLIAGVILLFPFLLLWAVFMVFTVEYLFKLLVVSALSPLFIVAAAFPLTRPHAAAALKVILQGALTVCISVISISVTLNAIDTATNALHLVNGNLAVTNQFGFFSMQFCSLFCLGIVAVLFQLKSPTIASNIVGVQDGAGVSGMIAGAPAAMGAALSISSARFFGKAAAGGAKGVGKSVWSASSPARDATASFGRHVGQSVADKSAATYNSIRGKLRS